MEKLIAQFMKFGVVGFIAFFIDYGLLAFCTEVLGINYLISATIGFTVSVVFNYLASGANSVSLTPFTRPAPAAQETASAYVLPAGTSVKANASVSSGLPASL